MNTTNYLRFLLTLLGCAYGTWAVAQQVSFSPTRIFFKGNPGETVSEAITIANTSDQPYEFVVSLADWQRDSLGKKIYAPMNTLAHSNAKHIQLSATSLRVEPGKQHTFVVSMRIPETAMEQSNASNSMLFFTQTNAQASNAKNNAGIGVKVSMELGVQLFYTPYQAEPGDLNFLSFITKEKQLAIKYENTGDINKDGFVRFELTNKQTGEERKLQPIPIAIMPHNHQWVYGMLPTDLASGDYLAVAILDAGSNANLKVAEKNIHVQ